jgi:hypothetical protein
MYLSFQAVAISNTVVKDVTNLTVPAKATHAELQADVGSIRYTMDNSTVPATNNGGGMILNTGLAPLTVLIEDLRRIKFIRNGSVDAILLIHYVASRE